MAKIHKIWLPRPGENDSKREDTAILSFCGAEERVFRRKAAGRFVNKSEQ